MQEGYYIIDRMEGAYAVLEAGDGSMTDIFRQDIPAGAREGDTLLLKDGKYVMAPAHAKKREKLINALAEELWED